VKSNLPVLTLYSRSYCHLCHDMQMAIEELKGVFDFVLEVFDVDEDPALEAKYDELVPVLMAGEVELCHYFLNEGKVRDFLQGSGFR
jgi:thiol-disulfide isomerase/thioredoxin